jgi:hypothetical protein
LINNSLPDDVLNNPYHLFDILPGGEDDFNKPKFTNGFSRALKSDVAHLIGPSSSPVFGTLEKVVWGGNPSVFGSVVSFIYSYLFD